MNKLQERMENYHKDLLAGKIPKEDIVESLQKSGLLDENGGTLYLISDDMSVRSTMRNNYPDSWVLLKVEDSGRCCYKVLAGYFGGYLCSSGWRLSSGVIQIEDGGAHWKFYGASGSCYHCNKGDYGVKFAISEPFNRLVGSGNATMLSENTDWCNLLGGSYD